MEKKEKIGGVTLDYTYYDEDHKYSDGEEVETFILNVFKEERDILEVLASDNRWPILYHLSPMRKNIVLPMDLSKNDSVLEIGSGMGAITEPLAERVLEVDCVELSKIRSLANAYRNKNQKNITIHVGSFSKIKYTKTYDVIVLIGVLEYAELYMGAPDPFTGFLRTLHDLLKPEGKLYIAIENRLGVKYLAGNPEDHWGKAFIGIEGYSTEKKGAKTFSKSELEQLLKNSGYGKFYFFYPLPDYKLPKCIYSDEYLPKISDDIPANVVYDADSYRAFNEQKVLNTLKNTEDFKILSNSFLVEAVKL
jgi:2-polyprenyl-3-methyl-5-hydroxy-6-metoxy-1,4-benzoquinol methylase